MSTRPLYSVLAILFFTVTNALLTQAQVKDDKPATASITGRVTFNNQPLSGVTVALESPLNLGTGITNTQRPPVAAKTDRNGRYHLTGIAAGYYLVWPRAMAYAMPSEGLSGRAGKTVNLSDGEQVEGVDFALMKGGVITGRITDHLGRPAIAHQVSLRQYTPNNRTAPVFSPTSSLSMFETDDRGIYRLFGLQSGRYTLSVGDEGIGRTNKVYARTFYPGVKDEKEAKAIEVTEDAETTGIDIKLPEPEKLYEAKGRVVDASTGRPLAGAQFAYSLLSGGPNSGGATRMTEELTNAQGEFVIQGLPAGKYAALMRTDSGSEYFSDPTPFEIYESDVEGLEIKAYRCASIGGVVIIEGTSDPAILKRVTGVKIDVYPSQTQRLQTPSFASSQMARPDGAFRLAGLRPGVNRISASDTVMNLLRLARIERDGVDIRESIELAVGEQVTGLKIVMAYGASIIRGQVAAVNGTLRPDLQLLVSATPLNAVPGISARRAQVDMLGRFVIEGLATGEYELRLFTVIRAGMPEASMPPPVRQKIKVGPGETPVSLTLDFGKK
jgi:hypothetical protein